MVPHNCVIVFFSILGNLGIINKEAPSFEKIFKTMSKEAAETVLFNLANLSNLTFLNTMPINGLNSFNCFKFSSWYYPTQMYPNLYISTDEIFANKINTISYNFNRKSRYKNEFDNKLYIPRGHTLSDFIDDKNSSKSNKNINIFFIRCCRILMILI